MKTECRQAARHAPAGAAEVVSWINLFGRPVRDEKKEVKSKYNSRFRLLYHTRSANCNQTRYTAVSWQPADDAHAFLWTGQVNRTVYFSNCRSAERSGRKNCILHAWPFRRRVHSAHLHPRHPAEAGRGGSHYGKFHGTGHVRQREKPDRKSTFLSGALVSVESFPRVGHGVGQLADPHFDPHRFITFCNKKSPKTEVFEDFWSCYPDSNWGPHPYQGCALPAEL